MGWDQFQDDETEYRKRRDALGPDQPAVITFDKRAVASLRDNMKEAIRACAGLGAGDFPAGRKGAYAQVVYPLGGVGTSGEKLKAFGVCPNASSCAVFIRGMWQLFGIGAPFVPDGATAPTPDRGLRCAYKDGEVFLQLAGFAFDCGALHGDATNVANGTVAASDIDSWLPGDVVFIRGPNSGDQHIFTIFEKPAKRKQGLGGLALYDVKTVDGGQGPCFGDPDGNKDAGANDDGNCRAIKATNKMFRVGGSKITVNGSGADGWTVGWWVDFSKLKTNEPSIWVPQVKQKLPGVSFPP